MAENMTEFDSLPENVQKFIKYVVKKVRYRKKVRADVFDELVSHFVDELDDIEDNIERQQAGEKLIAEFGQPEILAKLIRRGKKRYRPLWKRVLIAGFQIICVFVFLVGLRISTFYIGKPVIKIDYAKWLTKQASVGKDPNLNAKIDIDRAIELADFNEPDIEILNLWPRDMNDLLLQQTKKYLADNAQAINVLREAVNKPYFWVDYNNPQFREVSLHEALFFDESGSAGGFYIILSQWRHLAHIISVNIRFEIYSGDVEQAINDCFVLYRFAVFLQGRGFLVEQMTGTAIEGLVHGTISDILGRIEITEDQLSVIQEHYGKIIQEHKPMIDWIGQKAIWLDEIQRGFTDDGKGDGRVLAKGLRIVFENKSNYLKHFVLGSYHGRKEMVDEVEGFFIQADNFFQQTPFQINMKQLKITSSLFVFRRLEGLYESLIMISGRLRSGRLALVTTIAIKRYQKETGQLPVCLQQLVDSQYLDELPMDPFSDAPLIYKLTEDDFVLYSVGSNFKDDGGKVEYRDNGKVNQWRGDDYIFWPVRKKLQ